MLFFPQGGDFSLSPFLLFSLALTVFFSLKLQPPVKLCPAPLRGDQCLQAGITHQVLNPDFGVPLEKHQPKATALRIEKEPCAFKQTNQPT